MTIPAGTPISAKFAKVRVGFIPNAGATPIGSANSLNQSAPVAAGTTLYRSNWEVTPSTDPADVSNFEGLGFTDSLGTLQDVEATISGFWDAGLGDFQNPPNFYASLTLTNLAMFIKDLDGPYWFFPVFLVVSNPVIANVRREVQLSGLRIKNRGIFYYPTGQPSSAT